MARKPAQIDAALEQLFREHLPEDERRTHLLVDSRQPDEFVSLEGMLGLVGEEFETEEHARAAYAAQPTIIGTFVMPIGEPVILIADRFEDGTHHGTYRTHAGETGELPIGEIKTPEGRVFRLDE
jgi:hypothetical protein